MLYRPDVLSCDYASRFIVLTSDVHHTYAAGYSSVRSLQPLVEHLGNDLVVPSIIWPQDEALKSKLLTEQL